MMQRSLESEARAWELTLAGDRLGARIATILADRWWADAMVARRAARGAA